MSEREQRNEIRSFIARWTEAGSGGEKQDTQRFWVDLLGNVCHVKNASSYLKTEKKIKGLGYIDGYLPATKVLIEQKSRGIALDKKIHQSDGSELTPYDQALRYSARLPLAERPAWIVTCNFDEFWIYDQDKPTAKPLVVKLTDLEKNFSKLAFLVNDQVETISTEMDLSFQAGELVGKIYNALEKQYKTTDHDSKLRSLNVLCVRLVFCLYAEDAGMFAAYEQFSSLLRKRPINTIRDTLKSLFKILDTPKDKRDPEEDPELLAFPYVNGGLFADESIIIPQFNQEIVDALVTQAGAGFNWSRINPTIFGAVFESTLNPETRRKGGMHYTARENIHKVIDPLFLDDLKQKLQEIQSEPQVRRKERKLKDFIEELSQLTFLDPACGSGNFLTETYLCLRQLENDALRELTRGQKSFGGEQFDFIKVKIDQFYGIEINDFACSVAQTALWIAESQMAQETEDIIDHDIDYLPLKSITNIHEGNALRIDWGKIVPKEKLSYIMGNPPFVGASMMSKEQKEDTVAVFRQGKLINSIDYVGTWYMKAAQMIQGTPIRCCFVSTNSLTQGEQVFALWHQLISRYRVHIDFAYRTFRWDNEASDKAAVHCVIIGFSEGNNNKDKIIFSKDEQITAKNISPYLIDAPDVLIESRATPLFSVPKLTKGNQPTDDGNFILSQQEKNDLLEKHPEVSICVRRYVGAKDYLHHDVERYCLWLKNVPPAVYAQCVFIQNRIQAVKEIREKSTAAPTRAFAKRPYLFFSSPQSDSDYLIVPRVSSERRRYIPIGFEHSDVIASDSLSIIASGATIYHFGILESSVHMAWMRTVAGRLKSDYRYSGSVVYNNFPWPCPAKEQENTIKATAQSILDARKQHPDKTLAELYDNQTMPADLLAAHQANDQAVMAAYGFKADATESEIVARLMTLYQARVQELEGKELALQEEKKKKTRKPRRKSSAPTK